MKTVTTDKLERRLMEYLAKVPPITKRKIARLKRAVEKLNADPKFNADVAKMLKEVKKAQKRKVAKIGHNRYNYRGIEFRKATRLGYYIMCEFPTDMPWIAKSTQKEMLNFIDRHWNSNLFS